MTVSTRTENIKDELLSALSASLTKIRVAAATLQDYPSQNLLGIIERESKLANKLVSALKDLC